MAENYIAGDRQVHLYIAYYASQKQGAELISEDNVLADGKQWARVEEKQTRALIDGHDVDVRQTIMRASGAHDRQLVWSWYWVAGEFTSNPYFAKLLQAKAQLFKGSHAAAGIEVATDDPEFGGDAPRVLQDFLQHVSLAKDLNRFSP